MARLMFCFFCLKLEETEDEESRLADRADNEQVLRAPGDSWRRGHVETTTTLQKHNNLVFSECQVAAGSDDYTCSAQ